MSVGVVMLSEEDYIRRVIQSDLIEEHWLPRTVLVSTTVVSKIRRFPIAIGIITSAKLCIKVRSVCCNLQTILP